MGTKNKPHYSFKIFLPAFLFVIFGILSYFIFNYATAGLKHIDGTPISWYEPYIVAIGAGVIGFCIGKVFTLKSGNNEDNPDCSNFPFGAC